MSGIDSIISYAGRALKTVPSVIFEDGAQVLVNGVRTGYKGAASATNATFTNSVWAGLKTGGKALESSVAAASKSGSTWSRIWNSIKSIPSTLSGSTQAGINAAKAAGKSTVEGGIKGFFKGVGKKMPLIGQLITIGMELPNIFTTFKEKGFVSGLKEVGKTGAKLVGGAIGGAIGSCFGPIGSIVGYMAGEWLTSKIVGKSYTEQKQEQATLAQAQYQQYPPFGYYSQQAA